MMQEGQGECPRTVAAPNSMCQYLPIYQILPKWHEVDCAGATQIICCFPNLLYFNLTDFTWHMLWCAAAPESICEKHLHSVSVVLFWQMLGVLQHLKAYARSWCSFESVRRIKSRQLESLVLPDILFHLRMSGNTSDSLTMRSEKSDDAAACSLAPYPALPCCKAYLCAAMFAIPPAETSTSQPATKPGRREAYRLSYGLECLAVGRSTIAGRSTSGDDPEVV